MPRKKKVAYCDNIFLDSVYLCGIHCLGHCKPFMVHRPHIVLPLVCRGVSPMASTDGENTLESMAPMMIDVSKLVAHGWIFGTY